MADTSTSASTAPDNGTRPPSLPRNAPPLFQIRSFGATDVGRKRDRNEDSYRINEDVGLFVVCDGMGGHAGGERASRLAVDTIEKVLCQHRDSPGNPFQTNTDLANSPLPEVVRDAIESACKNIFQVAQADASHHGMGTTCSALVIHGKNAFVGHVGDSRVYLVRGDLIQQISEDHSLVNEQIKAGMITPEEAKNSRFKNIITRSVGFEEEVPVDVMGLVCEPGDTFIICCDGLSNLVEDRTMHSVVRTLPVDQVPARLVDMANDAGGDDNITVIAVQVSTL
jgi:protein phosphatase